MGQPCLCLTGLSGLQDFPPSQSLQLSLTWVHAAGSDSGSNENLRHGWKGLSLSRRTVCSRVVRSHLTQAHFPLSVLKSRQSILMLPFFPPAFPIWFLSLSFLPWGPRCPSGTGWEFPCCAPWWKLPQGLVGSRRSPLLLWRVLPTFCALSPSPRLLDEDQGTFSRNRKVSLKRCRIS